GFIQHKGVGGQCPLLAMKAQSEPIRQQPSHHALQLTAIRLFWRQRDDIVLIDHYPSPAHPQSVSAEYRRQTTSGTPIGVAYGKTTSVRLHSIGIRGRI